MIGLVHQCSPFESLAATHVILSRGDDKAFSQVNPGFHPLSVSDCVVQPAVACLIHTFGKAAVTLKFTKLHCQDAEEVL